MEKLGTVKATDLRIGKDYKVNFSGFKSVNGKRGKFITAYFKIVSDEGIEKWVNTPNENEAIKAIGVMSNARINGKKTRIVTLTPVKNGDYINFIYDVVEYIPEEEKNFRYIPENNSF